MAVDAFIKFSGAEGESKDTEHRLDRIGELSAGLGDAFIKLVDDVSDIDFLKTSREAHIKHDVLAIGHDFFKIGQEYIKLVGPLDKFDDAVVKFTDQFIKLTSDEAPFPLAADFVKFETDIKLTGLDFLATASDIKSDAPTESLSLNFSKISVDYKEQGNDALTIGADIGDFIKISGISESSDLGMAFIKFWDDWKAVGADYLKLSADFQKLAQDLVPPEGSGPVKFDQVVLDHASDFIKLSQDLKLTDTALATLGGELPKLVEAFENTGPVITPTFKLG